MIKRIIMLLSFASMASNSLLSQVKTEDFNFMNGTWAGVLEYTDYHDDKTKVQLTTYMSAASQFGKMMVEFTYYEPNGVAVYENMSVYARKTGDFIQFGSEKMKIVKKIIEKSSDSIGLIVLEAEGMDNDKNAIIRETIRYSKLDLNILKQVKYADSDAWVTRHEYRFQKEKSENTEARLLKNLVGTWELDLRPSPESDVYKKDFDITGFSDGKLKGVYYGTEFNNGKINTAWGKIYFSFSTADQSGAYHHAGYIDSGKMYGTSRSDGRDFMIPWFGEKKKN
jgi:hypothetical protein